MDSSRRVLLRGAGRSGAFAGTQGNLFDTQTRRELADVRELVAAVKSLSQRNHSFVCATGLQLRALCSEVNGMLLVAVGRLSPF